MYIYIYQIKYVYIYNIIILYIHIYLSLWIRTPPEKIQDTPQSSSPSPTS